MMKYLHLLPSFTSRITPPASGYKKTAAVNTDCLPKKKTTGKGLCVSHKIKERVLTNFKSSVTCLKLGLFNHAQFSGRQNLKRQYPSRNDQPEPNSKTENDGDKMVVNR
jgi:hypothetical protein